MWRYQFDTSRGICAVRFSERGLLALELFLEEDANEDGAPGESIGWKSALEASSLIVRYMDGEAVDFNSLKVDLEGYSRFFRQVCEKVRAIPYGAIASYGEIARMAGKPNAARAVGRVMASNPLPIIIPCHRVVAADGSLTGYSAAGGIRTKMAFLRMEGLNFQKGGRVISANP